VNWILIFRGLFQAKVFYSGSAIPNAPNLKFKKMLGADPPRFALFFKFQMRKEVRHVGEEKAGADTGLLSDQVRFPQRSVII
jgi:hypothetical protein